jgi:S-adenosylhomocysteine hydrolase
MDVTFGTQVLALVRLAEQAQDLSAAVHPVPGEWDDEVVDVLAAAMGLAAAVGR